MKNLVILDDEVEMEDLYKISFEDQIENNSLKIYFFFDSREFIKWHQTNEENIDLILCDINMPYISGIEVIENIRKDDIHTPIFVLSGFDSLKYNEDITRLNINKFISKPINFESLTQEINDYLLK
jgi:DNA-binding NtrC family response regulator